MVCWASIFFRDRPTSSALPLSGQARSRPPPCRAASRRRPAPGRRAGRASQPVDRVVGMGREVAESCVDGVVMEMVAAYCGRFYADKPELAARRIEAIGFQVGHQLTERYNRIKVMSLYYPLLLTRAPRSEPSLTIRVRVAG
jgi:hypothetical protein